MPASYNHVSCDLCDLETAKIPAPRNLKSRAKFSWSHHHRADSTGYAHCPDQVPPLSSSTRTS